jgi:Spy/CpxP family protein refolding chaperone
MKWMNARKTLIAAALIGAGAVAGTGVADPQHGGYGPGYGMGSGMMGGYGPQGGYGPAGGYGPGYGMGPGMMGGYGPGQGGGYGPGYGMGPGMMGPGYGGYGMGPGMMGGMMGPGMMGGYGPGYGMMGPGGGYGPGYGMMGPGGGYGPGYGMLGQLNLSSEQVSKINAIHEDLAKKQWDYAGRMREEAIKLQGLITAEKRDRGAINNQYRKLQDVRQQRFQARLEAQEKIDGVLTKEQKAQLRRFALGWGQPAE